MFSVPVSGHEAKGWLLGSMDGPEWLSGGAYGVEASAMALMVWSVAGAPLLRPAHTLGRFKACSGQKPRLEGPLSASKLRREAARPADGRAAPTASVE